MSETISTDTITIDTADGEFSAYLARPRQQPAPALVVIQEIFGVNDDLRKTCGHFAEQGFTALCPDLFWRLQPNVELTDQSDAEWQKGLALYNAFDIDTGVADIAATLAKARTLPGASGKVGVVGFCLGGLMTFLTAVRVGADAAVSYYGGGTDQYVGEARTLAHPLLIHLAEEDEFISKEAQRVIIDTLKGNPQVQIYTYPRCAHAFARNGGRHYDATAAAQAGDRTLKFLNTHLK